MSAAPVRHRAFEAAWYAQAMLRQLVLIYPTMAIMMQQQGIQAVSLALLFMIWSGTVVILELPTGVLADRVPRRVVLVVSGVFKGAAFLVWWLLPGFWGFALGFVVLSVGSAARSGTSEAFLHDTLVAQGRPESFEHIYGREQAASTGGVAVALMLGGWAAESGYTLPLLLSALAPWSSALLVALALREPPAATEIKPGTAFSTLASGMREILGHRLLVLLVAMIALLPTVYEVLEEFVGPLFDELGFSLTAVGLIYGLAFLAQAVSVMLAYRLRTVGLERLCGLFALGGAALAIGVLAGGMPAAAALCGYFAISGIARVLLQGRLQGAIRGHARATITSAAGLLQEVFSLAVYLGVGLAAQWLDWRLAVAGAGAWLVVSAVAFAAVAAGRPARREPAGGGDVRP